MANRLIPIVLIGLPLVMLGLFAVHNLQLEFDVLKSSQHRATMDSLEQTELKLKAVINEHLHGLVGTVKETLGNYRIEGPRYLILDQTVRFILIYQNSIRLYPPEDINSITYLDRTYLNLTAGVLHHARKSLEAGESFEALVPLPGESYNALLFCEHFEGAVDICVLQSVDILWSVAYKRMETLSDNKAESSKIVLQDMADKPTFRKVGRGQEVMHSLTGVMEGHALYSSGPSEMQQSFRSLSSLVAISLPLLLSWILTSLYFFRKQQLTLIENQRRADLMAQLSHELRTPLANLSLYTELVLRKADNQQAVIKYAKTMQQELERLAILSNSALAASQGIQAQVNLQLREPDKIIEGLLSRYSTLFMRHGSVVEFHAGASGFVLIDPITLESIVLQLLDNACKHSGSKLVELHSKYSKESLIIQVRDYGVGIKNNQETNLFELGYSTQCEFSSGFGVGLSAVQNLTRLYAGDVTVENVQPGTCFTVKLYVGAVQ